MASFHYTLHYRYKCRGGSGIGLAEVVLAHPLASIAEARQVLLETEGIVRSMKGPPYIREPWPQVTRIIQTNRDGRPLEPIGKNEGIKFP